LRSFSASATFFAASEALEPFRPEDDDEEEDVEEEDEDEEVEEEVEEVVDVAFLLDFALDFLALRFARAEGEVDLFDEAFAEERFLTGEEDLVFLLSRPIK
jgi:hypothetical protein